MLIWVCGWNGVLIFAHYAQGLRKFSCVLDDTFLGFDNKRGCRRGHAIELDERVIVIIVPPGFGHSSERTHACECLIREDLPKCHDIGSLALRLDKLLVFAKCFQKERVFSLIYRKSGLTLFYILIKAKHERTVVRHAASRSET